MISAISARSRVLRRGLRFPSLSVTTAARTGCRRYARRRRRSFVLLSRHRPPPAGSRRIDRPMRLLSDHGARLDVSFVSDLTLAGFEEMAAALDRDTILLILTVFEDAEGRTFIPRDAGARSRPPRPRRPMASTAPSSAPACLGGHVETFGSIGETMASWRSRRPPARRAARFSSRPCRGPWSTGGRCAASGSTRACCRPAPSGCSTSPRRWERYRLQILLAAAVILAAERHDRRAGDPGAAPQAHRRGARRRAARARASVAHRAARGVVRRPGARAEPAARLHPRQCRGRVAAARSRAAGPRRSSRRSSRTSPTTTGAPPGSSRSCGG